MVNIVDSLVMTIRSTYLTYCFYQLDRKGRHSYSVASYLKLGFLSTKAVDQPTLCGARTRALSKDKHQLVDELFSSS